MDENKNLSEAKEPLSEAELESVAGGVETKKVTEYCCPKCGGHVRSVTQIFGASLQCENCGARVSQNEVVKRVYTYTFEGNAHSVSADF